MGKYFTLGGAMRQNAEALAKLAAGAEILTEQDEYLMNQSAKEIMAMWMNEDHIFFEDVKTKGWEPLDMGRLHGIVVANEIDWLKGSLDDMKLDEFIGRSIKTPGGNSWELTNTEKVFLNRYIHHGGWLKINKPKGA